MKFYSLIILFIVLLVGVFGFIAPYLISAKSNELAFFGIGTIIIIIPVLILIFKKILIEGRKNYEKLKDFNFDDHNNDSGYNRMQQGSSGKRRY